MTQTVDRLRRSVRSGIVEDEGFGLMEIVVSMFLLGLLSVAFLPILIQGLQISARNTTLATANQLVNRQLSLATAAAPDCSAVQALAGTTTGVDARDVEIQLTTTVTGTCPTDLDAELVLTVEVTAVRTDELALPLVTAGVVVLVLP